MGSELSREDVVFGRAVIAFKLATREALNACVAEKRTPSGEAKTLARIAIERGVLTADQYRALVEAVRKRGASGDAASALPNVSERGNYAPDDGAPARSPTSTPDPTVEKAAARFERHAHEVVATGSELNVVTTSLTNAEKRAPAVAPAAAAPEVIRHPMDAAIRKKLRVKTEKFAFGGCSGLEFLGAGAVGAVYKGRDKSGQVVALKACENEDTGGDKSFRRFLQERRVLRELQHPGIVRVHDVAISDDLPYFTMEFVDGRKLGDLLQRDRPAREVLLDVVSKLADAVAFAHDRGIVLRDVHPGNVIVRTADGAPILMDLGFAKDQNADVMLTAADVKIGLPLYTAPEVQMSPKKASTQSDVYSLGVILYAATSGKLPYSAPSNAALLHAMLGTDAAPPSSVDATSPKALDAVCARALARDPAARHTNARAFLDDLGRARSTRSEPARPPGLLARLLARLGLGKSSSS
jgi:predicted Ser/Thr protein kinase